MKYLGLDKRYGQKDSDVSQLFFEENILNPLLDAEPKFLPSFGLTVLTIHLGPKHI
jgi:hypothetical protein